MIGKYKIKKSIKLIFVFYLILISCTPIAKYDSFAYKYLIELKIDCINLVTKSYTQYNENYEQIENLRKRIYFLYEYSKGRPNNEISTRQIEILMDPNRNSFEGFLKLWKDKTVLTDTFIINFSKILEESFDTIIALESGKLRPKSIK